MNKITEKLATVFNEKQINAMKDAWCYGAWGDAEVRFADGSDAWAYGACTNDIKNGGRFTGRQVSGIVSGISKKIDETNTSMISCKSDWWQDGSGDMIFFNLSAFGLENASDAWEQFNTWSRSND